MPSEKKVKVKVKFRKNLQGPKNTEIVLLLKRGILEALCFLTLELGCAGKEVNGSMVIGSMGYFTYL